MLTGRSLTKRFGNVTALCGVDVDVEMGKISVVIGPSGSGKTTLVRALSLLDPPTSGCVTIDGERYDFPRGKGSPAIKPPWPRLTVVFQQHFLWPHLTLRQNIVLPASRRSSGSPPVAELIAMFDMGDWVDRYPNEVSLGQRQRVALARAFALDPEYVLLDEITSALDVEQTAVVVKHLLSLRSRGIGMLVVTHLLAFARELLARNEGDMIYLLDDGSVAGKGGLEFFEKPGSDRASEFLSSMDYWSHSPRQRDTEKQESEP